MFKIITVGWECADVLMDTLVSIEMQRYEDFEVQIVDDASTNPKQAELIRSWCLRRNIMQWNYTINAQQQGAVRNQYEGIRRMQPEDEDVIVFLDLDGDVLADAEVLYRLMELYSDNTLCTYGGFHLKSDPSASVPVHPFPNEVVQANSYRAFTKGTGTIFNHLRTAKWKVLKQIPEHYFKWSNGHWLEAGTDYAFMLSALELSGGRYKCVQDDLFVIYNDLQPHPDNVRHPELSAQCNFYVLDLPPLGVSTHV